MFILFLWREFGHKWKRHLWSCGSVRWRRRPQRMSVEIAFKFLSPAISSLAKGTRNVLERELFRSFQANTDFGKFSFGKHASEWTIKGNLETELPLLLRACCALSKITYRHRISKCSQLNGMMNVFFLAVSIFVLTSFCQGSTSELTTKPPYIRMDFDECLIRGIKPACL